jgi:hypothetical protein
MTTDEIEVQCPSHMTCDATEAQDHEGYLASLDFWTFSVDQTIHRGSRRRYFSHIKKYTTQYNITRSQNWAVET